MIVGLFLDGNKHGLRNVVPTLCAREVAASLALSNPSWMAVNTARSSSATISETLVLREPRFSIICLACGIRESLGSPVSGSISHCERGCEVGGNLSDMIRDKLHESFITLLVGEKIVHVMYGVSGGHGEILTTLSRL